MNKLRLNANFVLNQKSYFNIGFLLYTCLDDSVKDKDYESIRICIVIGQTLYKNASEPNKPRVFLQNLLASNHIWKEQKFWEDIIKCNFYNVLIIYLLYLDIINEELHNQKNYNIYSFESMEEKHSRIQSSILYQLISYTYNMVAFNFDKQKTSEVLEYFKKYYALDENSCTELDKNFNEYSKLYETNVQNMNKSDIDSNETISSIENNNATSRNYIDDITQSSEKESGMIHINEASENKNKIENKDGKE